MLVDFYIFFVLAGGYGSCKIFHNYPESFMVVVFFNHIQSLKQSNARVQIDINIRKVPAGKLNF